MNIRQLGTVALGGLTLVSLVLGLSVQSSADEPQPPSFGVPEKTAAAMIHEASSEASRSEKPSFSDGRITLDEYLEAKRQATRCLVARVSAAADQALGSGMVKVEIVGPDLSNDEFESTYSYRLTPSPKLDQARVTRSMLALPDQIMGQCESQYSTHVEVAYQAGLLSDGDYVDRINSEVLACLRDNKVTVHDGDSSREVLMRTLSGSTLEGQSAGDNAGPADSDLAQACASKYPAIMAAMVP